MRKIYLLPPGTMMEGQGLPRLSLSSALWEQAYSLVMDASEGGVLQRFWKHQYGATAEMSLSGNALQQLEDEIQKILPLSASLPELEKFLRQLATSCVDARRQEWRLVVVAD